MELEVSFRIFDENLIPDEITKLILIEPSESHRNGEPIIGKNGRKYSEYKFGIWCLNSNLEKSKSLNEHLAELINKIESKKSVLINLVHKKYKLDFFIGVFSNGGGNVDFEINSENLKRLSELGTQIHFDLYE